MDFKNFSPFTDDRLFYYTDSGTNGIEKKNSNASNSVSLLNVELRAFKLAV